MSKKTEPASETKINIQGDIKGQFAVGNNISQANTKIYHTITSADMEALREVLMELRAKVETEAEPAKKNDALERVDELEQAFTEKKPDLITMQYVKNWFGKNIPALAGAVTSVVVHPIVGKLVEAGGDMLVKEFNEKFGTNK